MNAIDEAIARHLARPAMSAEDPLTDAVCRELPVMVWPTPDDEPDGSAKPRLAEGFLIALGLVAVIVLGVITIFRIAP